MEKLTSKYKLNEEQLNQLKQIVPEAFRDNILDFNSLYEALSDFTENDEDTDIEQFGLTWPGKRQAKRAAAIPPVGTLVPVPGDGVDEDTTRNIYIEGDNLEVLKILRKAYTGRIKMIYIDPPYNTGNDLIYPDDFSESVESYQKRTGQVDENGIKMTTNNRSDGRFHSKWCSMIYPRLRLARELLSEDGVIFISIDDNELSNLRKICDEIFGEENFVTIFPWRKRTAKSDVPFRISQDYEWIVCYSSSIKFSSGIESTSRKYYESKDYPNRPWRIHDMTTQRTASERPNSDFTMINPNNGDKYPVNPKAVWRVTKDTFQDFYNQGRIIFPGDYNFLNISKPVLRYFKDDDAIKDGDMFGYSSISTNLPKEVGMTQNGTKDIDILFGQKIFGFPKPVDLIKYFIKMSTITDKNTIILDFFSGSATTAHAVMKLNTEDGGNRKYIMVQIPEICDKDSEAAKAGFKNICEIGKERICHAGKRIKEEAGLNADNIDTGFKVFRLAPSNYKAWENYNGTDAKKLEELFKQDSLKPGWKEDDLLTEVMLLEGFPLDSKVELLPQFNKNKVKKISSDFHDNTLYICLDKDIHNETIETLSLTDKERFICLDSAIDDQSKIRLEDKNLIKTL